MRIKTALLLLILVPICLCNYIVTTERLSPEPIFSAQRGDSVFRFNYNAAFVPQNGATPRGLLVRCQNPSDRSANPGPSVIAFARQLNVTAFDPITDASVILEPEGSEEAFGVEDPRIVYDPFRREYVLLFSAVEAEPVVMSRLAMARSPTPAIKSSWKRMGPVFPKLGWSKSGALLVRERPPHFLFWGDNKLSAAISFDLVQFENLPNAFLETRADHFDSELVESGPMPLPLSDGNYLFIYNSARQLPTGGLQYNVGYLILNGTDPLNIIQRSETPILSPDLGWEKGTAPYLSLVPNVVFLEGWYAEEGARDSFIAYYGGADAVLGAVRIRVNIN